jgi:HSP20 family protein
MSLARWDPFRELRAIENRINRPFRRPLDWWAAPEEGLTTAEFAPPVDVYEDENKLAFKMEVPGIDPKDLDIRVDGQTLTITGERKLETEEKKENFRRMEREYGCFCRSFTLPGPADMDEINANFENGMLEIDVPKRAEARGRQIKLGITTEAKGKKAA